MQGDIHDLPKIADGIIKELLENQDSSTQENLVSAVKARGLLFQAIYLLHHVGIHDSGDGCEFGQDCGNEGEELCSEFERCKAAHERYMRLLGGWTITNEAVQDGN